jgi:hypothetical protein
MLHADQFCSQIEATRRTIPDAQDEVELRLKLGQCRGLLSELQAIFDEGQLNIQNASVRGHFRHLIMGLLWLAFRARHEITFKLFRMLVRIDSGFTYLLISGRISGNDAPSQQE